MKKYSAHIALLIAALSFLLSASAQDIDTHWTITDPTAEDAPEDDQYNYNVNAPATGNFEMTPSNYDGWEDYYYEWSIVHVDDSAMITRHEQSLNYTFTESGTYHIYYTCIFRKDGEQNIRISNDDTGEANPIVVTVAESALTMPNAFSPNGDGINDYYKPKKYQSLVSFRAIIFNRWGKKVYEWNDPSAEGWDGKINGKDAPQGVYFVNVQAKGSDGVKYNIKRDVNLLRGYTETVTNTSD